MKYLGHIIGVLGVLMVLGLILQWTLPDQEVNSIYSVKGAYDPALSDINDIRQLQAHINGSIRDREILDEDTAARLEVVDTVLSKRFYHGTSRYALTNKWLTYVLSKIFWSDLQAIVLPDDLMKEQVTLCSQQQIVFQEILKLSGYRYRTVGFNDHMGTEVFYNGGWHFYDSDYEPDLSGRPDAATIIDNRAHFEAIYKATDGHLFNENFESLLSTTDLVYYPEGEVLGQKMRHAHLWLKRLGNWGGFVLIMLYWGIKRRKH